MDADILTKKAEKPPIPAPVRKADKKGRPPAKLAPIVRHRPSSAVWANLTESDEGGPAIKVEKRVHKPRPFSAKSNLDLHPVRDEFSLFGYESIRAVLDRRKNHEKAIGTRLGHIYGEDHPQALEYTKQENARQAFDAKEAELVRYMKKVKMKKEDLHKH